MENEIRQPRFSQESFSRLWEGYESDDLAKQARDARWKELRSLGYIVKRSVLKSQMKKYDGFGQPNGGVCDVYMIDIINFRTFVPEIWR